MGWRYRKSMKLLPGVRLNFGLHGMSISTGVKGFRTTYSTTGRVTRTISIPGTGISYVTTSNSKRRSSNMNTTRNIGPTPAQIRQQVNADYDRRLQKELEAEELERKKEQEQIRLHDEQSQLVEEKISSVYSSADNKIDWKTILISPNKPEQYSDEEYAYLKSKAEAVITGDINTYFTLLQDINPFDDLQEYGSEFEFGTDDPRMMVVEYLIKDNYLRSGKNLSKEENSLNYQDFVCGTTLRVARDLFSLLPLRKVIIHVKEKGLFQSKTILSVAFEYGQFSNLDFSRLDPSDTIETFTHNMDFLPNRGFEKVEELE